ncbi:hypothetical protein [uncultured Brevibacillus sp.]|uniref:hypothetical protein n=1 Tax=uncultured Brevibacillus sp. TaxID=169970 RepID=UPI002596A2F9|nr:hypothetical protein [uncultured Brevibacillus sp.]
MNMDEPIFKVNESKLKWRVIIGNLALALLALLQTISIFSQQSNYELLYVAFAFPGFYYYITHKHNMGLGKAVLICLGLNRNFVMIKGFLIGVFGGFFIGWYLMYMNLYHFILMKSQAAKESREHRKSKGKDGNREDKKRSSLDQKTDDPNATIDEDEEQESLSLQTFTEEEDEERKNLLKSERPAREGR